MNPISPKATAGAGGASLGGPLVVVILWAFHLEPPPDVVASLTAVVSAALGFAAAYVTPHITTSTIPQEPTP